jgi:hypothetical protein
LLTSSVADKYTDKAPFQKKKEKIAMKQKLVVAPHSTFTDQIH